jgi:hypothetical protein
VTHRSAICASDPLAQLTVSAMTVIVRLHDGDTDEKHVKRRRFQGWFTRETTAHANVELLRG